MSKKICLIEDGLAPKRTLIDEIRGPAAERAIATIHKLVTEYPYKKQLQTVARTE